VSHVNLVVDELQSSISPRNSCCGTHLASTSDISLVMINPHTASVRGTDTRMFFLCGSRAITASYIALRTMKTLGGIISAPSTEPEKVVEAVKRLGDDLRDESRRRKRVEGELARKDAERVWNELKQDSKVYSLSPILVHRRTY
jgi:misacylated tRNA(Ala) deacylase